MHAVRVVTASLVAALAVAGVLAAVVVTDSRPLRDDLAIALAVTTYALVGLAIELARPGHPVGRLVLLGTCAWGVGEGVLASGVAGVESTDGGSADAVTAVVGSAARGSGWLLLVLALPLVFPDGRAPGRGPLRLAVGTVVAFTVATLVAPEPLESRLSGVVNPIGVPESWRLLADSLALGSLVAAFAALVVAVRTLVLRYRAGAELVRQQVLVFGIAFALPLLMLPVVATPWARPWMFALVTLPVPVAVGVAMFQRRLYDVQLAANRTLTYVALSAVLAGVYALVVGAAGMLLRASGSTWLPWVAAGVVAVAFAPLRAWLQRGVNQMTYGRWSAPAEVLADTGRRLADAADGRALLASVTDELVHGLGLEHAEISDTSGHVLATTGRPGPTAHRVPLTAYGVRVGELSWSGRPLRAGDRVLLADLAHQMGAAVHTTALVDSLRRAQEQLVAGREHERRRLRHDLHDGLGPSLAALGLQVDAVGNLLEAGLPVDDRVLRLREGLGETVAEVRRIVEGLRPPAIDDLGLFGAVAELGHSLVGESGLSLEVDLPDVRPALPAAVEVAAYRIAQEALTNVVRHAAATRCRVSGGVSAGALVLAVSDDGRGGAEPGDGLGLSSMGDRAREIGGEVEVRSRSVGTTVTLRLPVGIEAAT